MSTQDQSEMILKEQMVNSEVPAGPSSTQPAPSCSIGFCFTAEFLFPTILSWQVHTGTINVADQFARPQRPSVVLSLLTPIIDQIPESTKPKGFFFPLLMFGVQKVIIHLG